MHSEKIGEEIKRRRKAAGMTQVELAKAAGIHEITLSKLERGRTTPDLATLRRLEAALDAVEMKGEPPSSVQDLKRRREELKLSQQELANLSGVNNVTISRIERGESDARVGTIQKLHKAMDGVVSSTASRVPVASLPTQDEACGASAERAVEIPLLDVFASAGLGREQPDRDDVIEMIRVSADWLSANVAVSIKHLRIITARGDSMEPTFGDGDLLLVDTSASADADAIFVYVAGGQIFVKRLQRRPDGTRTAISDNAVYERLTITESVADFRIIGRVVYVWRGRKA